MENGNLVNNNDSETKQNTKINIQVKIQIILLLIVCISLIFLNNKKAKKRNEISGLKNLSTKKHNPLPSWNNCKAKNKLIEFMDNISNIPKEDRIAVFDFDGTLFQETDPVYNDWKIYQHRVLNDSNYTPTVQQKEISNILSSAIKKHEMPDDLHIKISYSSAEVFKNMTLEEYDKYLKDYLNQPADGYINMLRGDAFFIPMLEVIDYLQKYDFNIYIVSATDRYQVRSIIDGHINIPKSNIIGSDYDLFAINQGEKKGYTYKYKSNEKLVLKGELIMLNMNFNKINAIIRNIGKKPILIFGNSEGDADMAKFMISENEYKSLVFMVICDDLERERGNKLSADKMNGLCKKNNWITISMKNDWKTIYGEKVKKNKITY